MLRKILVLPFLVVLAAHAAEEPAKPAPKPPAKSAPKKKAPPKPTTTQLMRQLEEQRALIEAQQKLIDEQSAKLASQETRIGERDAEAEEQKKQLAALQEQLATMQRRVDEIEQELPAGSEQQLEERLKKIEEAAAATPDVPPNVITAGDFPGSIRIPGTDAAIKFGGQIRFAAVFTLAPLGSDDRFLTNSIPVESTDEAAGEGERTSFTANTSRFNFELRTPTGAGQMRAFIEGDFYGSNFADANINFRLRHAYAQFRGFLFGQTWSTFSDPLNSPLDMDFEGINGENVVRQPQIRYTGTVREGLTMSGAAETPAVSITGGQGVNVVPDLVFRTIWTYRKTGHIQGAIVVREIRGEQNAPGTASASVYGAGVGLSGVVPVRFLKLEDRFVFQFNVGKGIARYINDLSSLGGQDAAFDPATGELFVIPAFGWYVDYEHVWKEWERARKMKLRSAIIWSFVTVNNLDFQPGDAYHETNRLSVNLVFSPIERIDVGVQYLYGTRENKDGSVGRADQIQAVGTFRF